jgi:hypothetical protein
MVYAASVLQIGVDNDRYRYLTGVGYTRIATDACRNDLPTAGQWDGVAFLVDQMRDSDGEKLWARLEIASLEADIAFFNARLALLDGKAHSHYRAAELKAHRELRRVLTEMVTLLKGRPANGETAEEE